MSDGQSACDDCGQPVTRLFNITGGLRILDPGPAADGNQAIVTVGAEAEPLLRVRTLAGPELPADPGTAHRVHVCPVRPVRGPNCGHCGREMPRGIATRLRWSEHPACDPEFVDQVRAEQRATAARQFKPRRRPRRSV